MCPPGVDQTTRSAQGWNILAPTLRQQQPLFPASFPVGGNIRWRDDGPLRFCREGLSFGAFDKLTRLPSHLEGDVDLSWMVKQLVPPCRTSRLEAVPSELLGMIMANLEPKDIIALGLCSQTLMVHVVRRVHETYNLCRGGLAGAPVICTGTYMTTFPPALGALFPKVKKADLLWHNEMDNLPLGGRARRGMAPARDWNWTALGYYKKGFGRDNLEKGFGRDALEKKYLDTLSRSITSAKIPKEIHAQMEKSIRGQGMINTTQPVLLRNLTTREVVRMKVMTEPGQRNAGAKVVVDGAGSWLTLDLLLLWRIVWTLGSSGLPPTSPSELEQMAQGRWAGHSFDLVERVPETSQNEWQDITEALLKDSTEWKRILDGEFGHHYL